MSDTEIIESFFLLVFAGLVACIVGIVNWLKRCAEFGCPNDSAPGSWYCKDHKCACYSCPERSFYGDACQSHVRYCSEPNCWSWVYLRSRQDYCDDHKCLHCESRASHGPYCLSHIQRCSEGFCPYIRMRSSRFCSAHHYCKQQNCCSVRPDNSEYCQQHQCISCSRGATRGPFCNVHVELCAKRSCTQVREAASVYCKNHEFCQKRGCLADRPANSDFCQLHQCQLCLAGATRGAFCDVHVQEQCMRRGCNNARQPGSETCASHASGKGILASISATDFWEEVEKATPSVHEMEVARSVVRLAHIALSPRFPGATFIKAGSLTKNTGITKLMDIDLVLQIPDLSISKLQDLKCTAHKALCTHGFTVQDCHKKSHVVKASHRGFEIDVVLTTTIVQPGRWLTIAASTQKVLNWFSTLCVGCPQSPILCRSLKLWRHEVLQATGRSGCNPPCYALEVVAAKVRKERYFDNVNKTTLAIYCAESLRVLRKHLARGELSDPVNDGNNLLEIMKKEPDSLKWWQKEIDRTLRCWSWVRPPAGPDSTSNVSMFLGQQVFAKYRPKSRNFKPATIVGIHDGNVDLRFDGYDDIVRIPTSQIQQTQ